MEYVNYLSHHGVKGMKWGVRRSPRQLGHKASKVSSNSSKKTESKPKPNSKTKSVKEMSNQELQDAISRIQLEQKYMQLQPQKVSRGKSFIKKVGTSVLAPAAEDIARQAVKSFLAKQTNKHILPNIGLDGDEYKVYANNKKK